MDSLFTFPLYQLPKGHNNSKAIPLGLIFITPLVTTSKSGTKHLPGSWIASVMATVSRPPTLCHTSYFDRAPKNLTRKHRKPDKVSTSPSNSGIVCKAFYTGSVGKKEDVTDQPQQPQWLAPSSSYLQAKRPQNRQTVSASTRLELKVI